MKHHLRLYRIALVLLVGTLGGAGSIYAVVPTDTITTVAGDGTHGYGGDGDLATFAQLTRPIGVTLDAAGNLYIADLDNNRVRKVDGSGTITTVAGDGTQDYGGDNGLAIFAQMYQPYSVVVDTAGNLYIADLQNSRIRKVDPSGTITTVAGDGTFGYGGDDGLATSAQLSFPYSVAVDAADNLYIADHNNHRVRKVAPSGIITTVAGTGTQGYSGDNGLATSAQLNFPSSVAVDAAGNLYIVDHDNYRVRKVAPSGIITTVAGTGTQGETGDGGLATSAQLGDPKGMAVDAVGNLYISDGDYSRIRKVDHPSSIITTVAGTGTPGYSGDGGPAGTAQLASPYGIALDAAGNLYIADLYNYRVRRVANGAAPADTTAPTITITTPPGGAVYSLGQVVNADYACPDEAGGSGLASCVGPVSIGFAIDTSSVSTHAFTVNATDNAGNHSMLTHSYSVVYNASFGNNFSQPVDSPPTLNLMKGGASVPVKFNLGGNYGLNILAAGYPTSQQITCDTGAPISPIEEIVTSSNSGLTYDPTTSQYIYVWKTNKAWANTYRQFTLRLNDGTNHIALFKFN